MNGPGRELTELGRRRHGHKGSKGMGYAESGGDSSLNSVRTRTSLRTDLMSLLRTSCPPRLRLAGAYSGLGEAPDSTPAPPGTRTGFVRMKEVEGEAGLGRGRPVRRRRPDRAGAVPDPRAGLLDLP